MVCCESFGESDIYNKYPWLPCFFVQPAFVGAICRAEGGMGAPAGIKSNMYWLTGAIDINSQHSDFHFFD